MRFLFVFCCALTLLSIILPERRQLVYDCIIRDGMIYDGSGGAPFRGDIAILSDTIADMGDLKAFKSKRELRANGLAVAPGFINMLSWADENLRHDPYSVSDIKQGVTLEVLGEGFSPGPVKRKNPREADSLWTTLGGYFEYLERKKVTPNVASFVGATSVRIHEMNFDNRPPSPDELRRMKGLVQQSMEEGAMGLGASLIYPPAAYASTEELIEL